MNLSEIIKYVGDSKKLVDQTHLAEKDKSIIKMEILERFEVIELQLLAMKSMVGRYFNFDQ